MLIFNVRNNCQYKEISIDGTDCRFTTGLLDDAEALDVAKALIRAAEELLPVEYAEQDKLLGEIREGL